MPDRLALKRLTASDLTFFESRFRALNVGNELFCEVSGMALLSRIPRLCLRHLDQRVAIVCAPNRAGASRIANKL